MTKTTAPETEAFRKAKEDFNWYRSNDMQWRIDWTRRRLKWALWDFRLNILVIIFSIIFSIMGVARGNVFSATIMGLLAGMWAAFAYFAYRKIQRVKKELEIHIAAQKEEQDAEAAEDESK